MSSNVKPLPGVLPICMLCVETYKLTSQQNIPEGMSLCQPTFCFLCFFLLIFSSYCVLFLFVLHVQFCKAKSRCALSQLFRQQRSLTVSFALTYLTVLPSPYSSTHSSLFSFPVPTHFFPVVTPIISVINSLLRSLF